MSKDVVADLGYAYLGSRLNGLPSGCRQVPRG